MVIHLNHAWNIIEANDILNDVLNNEKLDFYEMGVTINNEFNTGNCTATEKEAAELILASYR